MKLVTNHLIKKILLLFFCTLQFAIIGKSQVTNSENNISLELGLGYNTINMEAIPLSGEKIKNNRNQFSILPSFKVKYSLPLFEINNNSTFELTPFVGYNMFGGKSKKESNGYKDKFRLQALEIGFLPTYSVNEYFKFYAGFKSQYILSSKLKYYGAIADSDGTERTWKTNNQNDLIKDIAFSLGVGFNYMIERFSIGIETWQGITNLSALENNNVNLKIHENNYRLIVGYRIK